MNPLRTLAACTAVLLLVLAGGSPQTARAAQCTDVSTCISQLRFGETQALRELAAERLGERGAPDAIPYLAEALAKDDGEFVRVNAAQALGQIGTIASVKPLTQALANDKRELVRVAAGRALGNIQAQDAATDLVTALQKDPEWQVRAASAESLGQLQPPGAVVTALSAQLLNDGRVEVRIAVADALASLKAKEGATALVHAMRDDPVPDVRIAATKALGVVIDGEAVDKALLAALQEERERIVRRTIVETMGQRKRETVSAGLVHALQMDPAIEVRTAAAGALGQIGGQVARDALSYYAKNSLFPQVRRAAQDALAVLPEAPASKPIASANE
ncbi:MAG TPA: HEAT repeat domain-containing protein [bacterium]|nr:HEAT repeat domain-containing protein [bacterium]